MLLSAAGLAYGLVNDAGGVVNGVGGVISGDASSAVTNSGTFEALGSNNYLVIAGSATNAATGSIIASATGSSGAAEVNMDGAAIFNSGLIEAVATSTGASAGVFLVNATVDNGGGRIVASGKNGVVDIDNATISGGGLQTVGSGSVIGVVGGHGPALLGPDSGGALISNATISANSFIFDNGLLGINGGTVGSGVTLEVDFIGAHLRVSGTTFGAGDKLLAEESALLTVSAVSGGNVTFGANTLVEAITNGSVDIEGGVINGGTIGAVTAGNAVLANVTINAGSGTVVSNTSTIEALATSGFNENATVAINGSATITNSGIIEAKASVGVEDSASVTINGAAVTNTKTIEAIATSNTSAELTVTGSSGVVNSGLIEATASSAQGSLFVGGGTAGLVNAKTGTIEELVVSAPGPGSACIDFTGAIVNAGGILMSAARADLSGAGIAGGSLVNSGTIAWAASNRGNNNSGNLSITGSTTNAATIAVAATSDSTTELQNNILGGAFLNSGTLIATATTSSLAFGNFYNYSSSDAVTNANSKTIEASASGHSVAFLVLDAADYTSNGIVTNNGTLLASASGNSTAYQVFHAAFASSNGTIINNGTAAANATSRSTAYMNFEASDSAGNGVITNNGTAAANATSGSLAYLNFYASIEGGSSGIITNNGTAEATATAGGIAYIVFEASIQSGSNGAISNSGTMAALATGGNSLAELFLSAGSGGSLTNSAGKVIEVSAQGGGTASAGIVTSSTVNRGTIEALANGAGSFAAVTVRPVGAQLDNGGGTLLASATAGGTAQFALGNAIISGGVLESIGNNAAFGLFRPGGNATIVSATIAANTHIMVIAGDTLAISGVPSVQGAGTLRRSSKPAQSHLGPLRQFRHGRGLGQRRWRRRRSRDGDHFCRRGTVANTGVIEASRPAPGAARPRWSFLAPARERSSNSGVIEALATGAGSSTAAVFISGGTGTVANSGIIKSLATSFNEAFIVLDNNAGIVNSKTILGSAAGTNAIAYVGLSAGSGGFVTNSGVIDLLVTSAGSGFLNIVGSGGTSVMTNSGTVLVSADEYGDASLMIGSGTAFNSGAIKLAATAGGTAHADVSATMVNASGTITVSADPASYAAVVFDGDSVNNANGVISAAGNGRVYLKDGASISGGMLGTSGSQAFFEISGGNDSGAIDGATIGGSALAIGATLTLSGDTIAVGATVQALIFSRIEVSGTVTNAGTLLAGAAGNIDVDSGANVIGGVVTIGNYGAVNVASGGSANAFFDQVNGWLRVADTSGGSQGVFTGDVYGFGGVAGEFPGEVIELDNVPYASGFTASYSLDAASANPNLDVGELVVSSGGVEFADITLVGNYTFASFSVISQVDGNLGVIDPLNPGGAGGIPVARRFATSPGPANVPLFANYIASLFPSGAGGQRGSPLTGQLEAPDALLTHPKAT